MLLSSCSRSSRSAIASDVFALALEVLGSLDADVMQLVLRGRGYFPFLSLSDSSCKKKKKEYECTNWVDSTHTSNE